MGKRVLIIDDDRTISSLLKTLLELDNFEVMTITRGSEVIARADSFQPDAFVVDFHLQDMDGIDVIQELRSLPAFAAKLIIVASGMDKEEESLAAGANYFLLKPYDPDILTEILNES